jgi:hypothetical protein
VLNFFQKTTYIMRHFMFKNALAATDPVTVAQGFDLPPPPPITDQTHTYYYSPDAYLAPCDLVLASAETITVHFNAPISVRWMKSEEQIDERWRLQTKAPNLWSWPNPRR